MLDFFRRHQRYFFVIITVIIVISFSFFGTYNSMNQGSFREQIAFRTVEGTDITRHELDEMVAFLSTDNDDKQYFGGVWGLNFLNDGVITKNFFQTPLAAMLLTAYADEVSPDLTTRQDKEHRFTLYSHPQARFIGTEMAWNYFLPDMTRYYHHLHASTDPLSSESIQSRIALFMMQRQLPPSLLRRVLKSQEAQYSWLKADQNLDHTDLSIFGYHTMEDWFGPRFIRLAAQFIINAAEIAEKRGYYVSKADAMADLMHNAEVSFKQNQPNPNFRSANSREYFDEQLRHLGMDRSTAVRVWQQVLLFRRLFQDMGSSMFVDPQMFEGYETYALASIEGEIYRLPNDVRLNRFDSLQKFETYLDIVGKRTDKEKNQLKLPEKFASAAVVSKNYPELVQQRYLVDISHADKKSLEGNVSLKETWAWEVEDQNWSVLKKQFPELGLLPADNVQARYAALDTLDDKTRARIDHFAREAIVDQHPEWIEQALLSASPVRQVLKVHEKGKNQQIIGLTDGKALMALLDKKETPELSHFTADHRHYYKIAFVERANGPEVLTFAEADHEGALDRILDQILEEYYVKIRESNTKEFQREDKSWKALADVKNAVADRYFEKLLRDIRTIYASAIAPQAAPENMIGDYAATLRLYPYMRDVKILFEKDPSSALKYIGKEGAPEEPSDTLQPREPLEDQWKLQKAAYGIMRNSSDTLLDKTEVFALSDGQWTKVNTPGGDLNFFHLLQKHIKNDKNKNFPGVIAARSLLSDNAQKKLMQQILKEIVDKKAISLEYLSQTKEEDPDDSP